jgi:hypothetical protein
MGVDGRIKLWGVSDRFVSFADNPNLYSSTRQGVSDSSA